MTTTSGTKRRTLRIEIDADLLESLDALAKRDRRSRTDIVEDACRAYVRSREAAAADRAYRRAYRRMPEPSATGQIQVALASAVLPEEVW